MPAAGVGRTVLRDVGPDRDTWSWGVRSTDPARERDASGEPVGASPCRAILRLVDQGAVIIP